jgi:hypothetical glycosyl hydrolase
LLSLEKGGVRNYHRTLNLKTGELVREFEWMHPEGKTFQFSFRRFVSFSDLHTLAARISITPLNGEANISIVSGINGQMTNSGSQHFQEGERRVFDRQYLRLIQQTTQSGITFVHHSAHRVACPGETVTSDFGMDRRKVYMRYEFTVRKGVTASVEKISNVYTSRDRDTGHLSAGELVEHGLSRLKEQRLMGFESLLDASAKRWADYWSRMDIKLESEHAFDQLAIRFSQYHLLVMAPRHDNRYGIAAKGLSGEGYKGHSFWDTEIFILPFFTFCLPEIARSLLEYRFHSLKGAREKAKKNGFRGAMYPWESAWLDDGEVTPAWGEADIVTGAAQKIWTGEIEIHISADIAYAVWQYYQTTRDEEFMKQSGHEILFDTAIFWGSRLEWNDEHGKYHINKVIGPDEYKEHINNDAYTNHMAHWCMEKAVEQYHTLKENDPETFQRLNELLQLDEEIENLQGKLEKIYLPAPNKDQVIPQEDTYLQKQIIDLGKYKRQEQVGSIFRDYNIDQINQIQVTKQASVIMLLYLLEERFNDRIKQANFHYYEPKTLHDSSLSLSTHAVLAADVDELELAYGLFRKAAEIDLGPNMKSSNQGIHAASLGGIWQIVVCGFGGLRITGDKLRINPNLPTSIRTIHYPVTWRGNPMKVLVSERSVTIENNGTVPVEITVRDKTYLIKDKLRVNY